MKYKSRKGVIIISDKTINKLLATVSLIMLIILTAIGVWRTNPIEVSGEKYTQEESSEESTKKSTEEIQKTVKEKKEEVITVWTTSNLNIREYPDRNSDKMGMYEWGKKLKVIYVNEEWAKIKKTGYYVNRTYLSEAEINPEDFYWEAEFKLTAYCPCSECSAHWGHKTSTGKTAISGRTIAVDPSVIPYGSEVTINGNTYIAEDCGGGVNGYHIDIFMNSHKSTVNFGVQYKTVRVWK